MADRARTIPFNFRTGVFCFLAGAAISVPLERLRGFIDPSGRGFIAGLLSSELPDFWCDFGAALRITGFIILPFWSTFLLRGYEPLPKIGRLIFILVAIVNVLASTAS